jgi:HEAT repeat protein
VRFVFFLFFFVPLAFPQQQPDPRQRARAIREWARQGADGVPSIAPFVRDPDLNVRLEVVKALGTIGGPQTVDALVEASRDNDPEIQIRATDALVNVYLPGYLRTGLSGTLQRAGSSVRGKFTDTNDQMIDGYVQVRAEVIEALGRLARGGSSLESRANAARAVGILRGRGAIPDLVEALYSKDGRLMYESLIALRKIGDPAAAPQMAFLLRDLDEKVQIAALEVTGIFRNAQAAPTVRDALERARNRNISRAALTALAMIADPADRGAFLRYLSDRDGNLRAAAAEGLARLKNPADRELLNKAFSGERDMSPRLSAAFALVSLGNLDTSEFSPLRYLVNSLNSASWRGVSLAFLTEVARDLRVRQAVYPLLERGSKEERIHLSTVLARSGERDSVPYLETLSRDPNPDVAQEGIRSLRTLRARLP